jgi:aryl-alcohol dehydrogenase-like predicted oxidoreductase
VPIATVQNRYNLTDRGSEDVLDFCEREGIGFIPWFPLASGYLVRPGRPVSEIALRHDATPGQVALAWLLAKSPVMLPIPGTSSVKHLEENIGAAYLRLSDEELATLCTFRRSGFYVVLGAVLTRVHHLRRFGFHDVLGSVLARVHYHISKLWSGASSR